MSHPRVLGAVAGALLGALALAASASANTVNTNFNPNNFDSTSTTINNPWLPFPAGATIRFIGEVDGKSSTDTETVTGTIQIDGVSARVVHDEVAVNKKVIEKTDDYYAQDKQGNVWYMGELAKELVNGKFVVASDSWTAGEKGAQPGIIQEINPKVGDTYTEENAPGVAQDQAKVISLTASVPKNDVPYCNTAPSACNNLLETLESSPLDPQTENKWYAKNVGEVKEAVSDGSEHYELVSISRP